MPEGHNPLGCSLALARRRALLAVARRHRVPVIEDDAYGLLRHETAGPPPLAALDPEVLLVGSVSKVLGPALRVGWLVVPEERIPELSRHKEAMDTDSRTLAQWLVATLLGEEDTLHTHLAALRAKCRERRDVLLDALRRHLPEGQWRTPEAGLFVWVRIPGVDAANLASLAMTDERVVFLPDVVFGPPEPDVGGLRLAFGSIDPAGIVEGVRRLARVARREQASLFALGGPA
jgi:DNA-binding transcriptional MocR family regulator